GTALDLFGRQAERRSERALVEQYIADLHAALAALRPETLDIAVAIAELPDMIRGFGPVKDANRAKAETQRQSLLAEFAGLPLPSREGVGGRGRQLVSDRQPPSPPNQRRTSA
ncbi:MAG TPA: DUF6537 domain-containing protein, partial [Acetobacteraceae bacterium]|nr:DUF6537 domain-containing protein [Acetobacteraceae bacterium]